MKKEQDGETNACFLSGWIVLNILREADSICMRLHAYHWRPPLLNNVIWSNWDKI